MKKQLGLGTMRVHIKMLNATGVEGAGPANKAVDFIAFGKKQLG